jgi:ribosomal protein S18 acetylase RimI-like enzyme
MSPRRWVFERGILYGIDLTHATPHVTPQVPATFQEIGVARAHELALAMETPDVQLVAARLATHRRCFGAFIENRIAAYAWVSQTNECIGEQEREIQLQPQEAYIWDCATRPECRRQHLYSALLSYIVRELQSENIRRVWIGSSLTNQPSLKGFTNAGFQPALALIYLRVWNVHGLLAIGPSSAPALLVQAARRAVLTEQERQRGAFIVGWALPPAPPPCTDIEPNARTI